MKKLFIVFFIFSATSSYAQHVLDANRYVNPNGTIDRFNYPRPQPYQYTPRPLTRYEGNTYNSPSRFFGGINYPGAGNTYTNGYSVYPRNLYTNRYSPLLHPYTGSPYPGFRPPFGRMPVDQMADGIAESQPSSTSHPASQPADAAGYKFTCKNSQHFEGTLALTMTKQTLRVKLDDLECRMTKIEYNPRSSKYEGWIRFGVKGKDKSCLKIGTKLFGSEKETVDLYWLSVSKEMQDGETGFSQLGFENIWDPGAGAEAKTFLRCYAD